jgi:membrane fusion protein (multidrug efflux system)
VLFKEGQKIVAGQVLLQLEDRKQLLRLERASADVASTRAELSRAESTFKRYQALMGQQVISEDDYKQKESAYNAALAQLQQVMAVEKLAQQELRDLTLISPVSGIVEVESVEPGQKVHPGQQLAVVQTANSMQVLSYVTEKEVNLLHVGDVAPMRTPGVPGRNYEARIESIGSTADSRTGNFAVKLRVDNGDGLLREGMSAHIQLQGDQGRDRLALPRSAVVDRDRRRVVFLVRDGRAVAVAPSLGMAMGDWIPVLSGLSAGDQVVIDQLALLADGSPVQARPVMDVAPMR